MTKYLLPLCILAYGTIADADFIINELNGFGALNATSAPACVGTSIGGFCWYLGNTNQSCTNVCGSHGGYNAGTLSYAGSGAASDANCNTILLALGVSGSSGDNMTATGIGCAYMPMAASGYRITSPATVEGAADVDYRRVCACNN